jgi:hypothetical protein
VGHIKVDNNDHLLRACLHPIGSAGGDDEKVAFFAGYYPTVDLNDTRAFEDGNKPVVICRVGKLLIYS